MADELASILSPEVMAQLYMEHQARLAAERGQPQGDGLQPMPPMPPRQPSAVMENRKRPEDPMAPVAAMVGMAPLGPGGPAKAASWMAPAAGGIAGFGLTGQYLLDQKNRGQGYEGNPLWPMLVGGAGGAATAKGGQMLYNRLRGGPPPSQPPPTGGPGAPPSVPDVAPKRPPLTDRMNQGRGAVGEPPPPALTPEKTPTGVRYRGPGGRWYSDPNKKSSLGDFLMGDLA